ncbi:MAG: adenylate/guanylate cyclase domain-containing protein [Thermodesulfobacteriota bacterium]
MKSVWELFRAADTDSVSAGGLVLDHLNALAIIEDDAIQKMLLKDLIKNYVSLERRVDTLLKNTLPEMVAEEIKYEGKFYSRTYECTILFSDFAGFTRLAERMSGEILIETLNTLFTGFDELTSRFSGTKIKTIGDAYMAVFGAPEHLDNHAIMAVRAAMGFQRFLEQFNRENTLDFQMRIGIHTGEVMAGVVGRERMQFDIFGDNVNVASRFESSGEKGKINVSEETYLRTKETFKFEERGLVMLKNKENMKAYFVIDEL